tara:strand:+ start:1698 stop:2030 length:333 start_codon:yes stop_codon:yes gene_type:complete
MGDFTPIFTKFNEHFMWSSGNYPYTHNLSIKECQQIIKNDKEKLEKLKLIKPEAKVKIIHKEHFEKDVLEDIKIFNETEITRIEKQKQLRKNWIEKLEKLDTYHPFPNTK